MELSNELKRAVNDVARVRTQLVYLAGKARGLDEPHLSRQLMDLSNRLTDSITTITNELVEKSK